MVLHGPGPLASTTAAPTTTSGWWSTTSRSGWSTLDPTWFCVEGNSLQPLIFLENISSQPFIFSYRALREFSTLLSSFLEQPRQLIWQVRSLTKVPIQLPALTFHKEINWICLWRKYIFSIFLFIKATGLHITERIFLRSSKLQELRWLISSFSLATWQKFSTFYN